MHAIKARWTRGQIVPDEPVDWPEGSRLLIEPLDTNEPEIGMREEDWNDDPESIAAWTAAVNAIQPLEWLPGEEEEYERYRAQHRQFNIEAVRQQMAAMDEGESS